MGKKVQVPTLLLAAVLVLIAAVSAAVVFSRCHKTAEPEADAPETPLEEKTAQVLIPPEQTDDPPILPFTEGTAKAADDPFVGASDEEKMPDNAVEPMAESIEPTEPAKENERDDTLTEEMTYRQFLALSGTEKDAYKDSFADVEAFADWVTLAQEAYQAEQSGTQIDLDDSFSIR